MKKFFCLFMVLTLVLSLCACSEETAQAAPAADRLLAGFGKVDMTPDYPVGLGGYSDAESRTHNGIQDHIYSTCIAVTSGEQTVLMFTIDICGLNRQDKDNLRLVVSNATGVVKENIFIGATHGHNCPALTSYPNAQQYTADFNNAAIEAAKLAVADQAPATLYRAKDQLEGMNFVRHYTLEDGTLVDNSGANGNLDKIIGHPMEKDNQLILLKFDRDEDKKDILTVHWQAHPDDASSIGYNLISPGFIGPLRNKLTTDTGMLIAYFNGASGNQNRDSKYAAEKHGLSFDDYGEKLADMVVERLPLLEEVQGTEIKIGRHVQELNVDHSWDDKIREANAVYELWKSTDKATGDELGKQYGFSSVYQARAIRSRANMGPIIAMEMGVFSIGDIGFTEGTYEMFSTNALYVKQNSPFETTVVITGNYSYMPAQICYSYRSYESDTGFYAEGSAETMAEQYVKMLKELKS